MAQGVGDELRDDQDLALSGVVGKRSVETVEEGPGAPAGIGGTGREASGCDVGVLRGHQVTLVSARPSRPCLHSS